MKKGKAESCASVRKQISGLKKKVKHPSCHILCTDSIFHYWNCFALNFSGNGIKDMTHCHFIQRFNILADSVLENALRLKAHPQDFTDC